MSAEELSSTYRSFIQAINERRLDDIDKYVAYPVIHNGKSLTKDEHVAHLRNVTSDAVNTQTDVDILLVNADGPDSRPLAAARLLVTLTPGDVTAQLYGLDASAGKKRVRIANHFLIWFTAGASPKIAELANIVDTVSMGDQLRNQDRPLPDIARAAHFTGAASSSSGGADLGKRIQEWYGFSAEGTLAEHAADYFQDEVTVMGTPFKRDGLLAFVQQGLAALSESGKLKPEIKTIVVDNAAGLVSVRFQAAVKLAKPFVGIQPNGKEAKLEEQVFYRFKDGKISAMDTVMNVAGLRMQMYGGAPGA